MVPRLEQSSTLEFRHNSTRRLQRYARAVRHVLTIQAVVDCHLAQTRDAVLLCELEQSAADPAPRVAKGGDRVRNIPLPEITAELA